VILPYSSGSDADGAEDSLGSSGTAICYSIEIKDTILPPWTVSGLCAAMSSDGRSFESRYVEISYLSKQTFAASISL